MKKVRLDNTLRVSDEQVPPEGVVCLFIRHPVGGVLLEYCANQRRNVLPTIQFDGKTQVGQALASIKARFGFVDLVLLNCYRVYVTGDPLWEIQVTIGSPFGQHPSPGTRWCNCRNIVQEEEF